MWPHVLSSVYLYEVSTVYKPLEWPICVCVVTQVLWRSFTVWTRAGRSCWRPDFWVESVETQWAALAALAEEPKLVAEFITGLLFQTHKFCRQWQFLKEEVCLVFDSERIRARFRAHKANIYYNAYFSVRIVGWKYIYLCSLFLIFVQTTFLFTRLCTQDCVIS